MQTIMKRSLAFVLTILLDQGMGGKDTKMGESRKARGGFYNYHLLGVFSYLKNNTDFLGGKKSMENCPSN